MRSPLKKKVVGCLSTAEPKEKEKMLHIGDKAFLSKFFSLFSECLKSGILKTGLFGFHATFSVPKLKH